MKRSIISVAAMVMAVISVHAQQPGESTKETHHQQYRHHGHGRGMMAKKLNLSDQQKEQFKNINSDYHKKIVDLKKHDEITVRDFKFQMSLLHKERRSKIQALLTPAQKDQLAKMKQQRMQMVKINAGARAEKMKIKLGLTDAQASQLQHIRSDMAGKIKTIHTDSSLSREQKHEQIKSIVLQQQNQLKTILTADQLQQLQQLRSQHHKRDFSK